MRISESNMEHYRNEILEAIKDSENTFGKHNGKIGNCRNVSCCKCDFNEDGRCSKNKLLWLMEDYKPEITLTAKEKHMVELIETGWLVRESDGDVWWHYYKPCRSEIQWSFPHEDVQMDDFICFDEGWNNNLFEFIKWEDKEPWSVEDLRKLKVAE